MEGLALLSTTTRSDPKYITVAVIVVLQAMFNTPLLFSTQAATLFEMVRCDNVAEAHACMAF